MAILPIGGVDVSMLMVFVYLTSKDRNDLCRTLLTEAKS